MGRKGVSKRKPQQTKAKPFVGGAAAGSVSSVMQEPVRSLDTGKILPTTKAPADHRKKTR